MAASDKTDTDVLFHQISTQFLEMIPLRRMKWSIPLSAELLSVEVQKKLLEFTVLSPLCKCYPPALSYQRAFVKKFLHLLEESDVEICDEVYEAYTELLRQQEEDDDTLCYKTYTLAHRNTVTLQESVNMISCGTTGLSTWQAAQHLAEWALQNQTVFEGRNVLELGSGLGLTGISIVKQCHCNSFTFTDCHAQVLYLLAKNIELNLASKTTNSSQLNNPENCDSDSSKEVDEVNENDSDEPPILRRIKRQLSLKSGKLHENEDLELSEFSSASGSCGIEESERDNVNVRHDDTIEDLNDMRLSSAHWTESECGLSVLKGREDVMLGQLDWENPDVLMMERFIEKTDVLIAAAHWTESECGLIVLKGREDVMLGQLDWENPDVLMMERFIEKMDVLIAADVVYDKTVIPDLVSVLKCLLCSEAKRRPHAYIASTIRNEDTRDQFLIYLSTEGLQYELTEPPRDELFHYDRSVPIEILRISAMDLT